MPEDQLAELIFRVDENVTDRLSAMAIHARLERLVDRVVDQGEDFLRVNVAASIKGRYGTTGELEAHVDRTPIIGTGDLITGSVGIPPVHRDFPFGTTGDSAQEDYPIYKDRGTGIFGDDPHQIIPATKQVMKFEGMFGETVYRHSVAGQEGAEFSRRTYEEMFVALPANVEVFERELRA